MDDNGFMDDFNDFVKKRTSAGLFIAPDLPAYYDYLIEVDNLKEKLSKLTGLDPEDQETIEQLPNIIADAGKIFAAAAYIQGLRDMQSLTNVLQDVTTYA